MHSSEKLSLVMPDGTSQALKHLPLSRADAIHTVRQFWAGTGRYSFVRQTPDPVCGEVEISEVVVSAYQGGEVAITGLASGAAFDATSADIAQYLRAAARLPDCKLQLSIDVYANRPADDFERNNIWLSVEEPSSIALAEFLLNPCGQLSLGDESESRAKPVFFCELPSFRSALRFVDIACEVFHCEHVHVRSFPLNSESVNWFA